jgi:hypothetical protein
MATYTTNTGIYKIATGDLAATWGDATNTNFDIIDRAISGIGTLTLSGATSTLSTTDGTLSDGMYRLLILSGTPDNDHTITVSPADAQKVYIVQNNTTAQDVIFTQGSGGNVTVPNGTSKLIYCDGAGASAAVTDVTGDLSFSDVSITGGSITGITDLAIADGGTGASSASDARTNLGVVIGTDVLAYDANLQSFVTAFTLPTSDGTANQVLTTNGSGTLSLQDQRTAGSTQLTATGAVSAGELVVLNTNGTVSSVADSDSAISFGTAAALTSNQSNYKDAFLVYDTTNNQPILVYLDDSSTTSDVYAVVGSVSGTSFTWGTPVSVAVSAKVGYGISACFDSSSNDLYVAYVDNTNSTLYTVSASVSGSTITFSGASASEIDITFPNASDSWRVSNNAYETFHLVYDTTNDRVLIIGQYLNTSLSNYYYIVAAGVPGSPPTWGVGDSLDLIGLTGTRCSIRRPAYNSDNNTWGILLMGGTSTDVLTGVEVYYDSVGAKAELYGYTSNFTMSSVTVGSGSKSFTKVISPLNISYSPVIQKYVVHAPAYDSSNNYIMFAFPSSEGTKYPDSSGYTKTLEKFDGFTRVDATSTGVFDLAYDSAVDRFTMATIDSSGAAVSFKYTGTLPTNTTGTNSVTAASAVGYTALTSPGDILNLVADPDNNKIIFHFSDNSLSSTSTYARVMTPPTVTTTVGDWVGLAESAIADGDTGFVTVVGGINDQQSSLTPNSVYYLTTAGALTTSVTSYKIGKALTATELLVTEGNA